MTCIALIVAGGRGSRAGGASPKQYQSLNGATVLAQTVRRFLGHPSIDDVCVVIHPDDRTAYDAAVQDLDLMAPVLGGATRQESVLNGLRALKGAAPDLVAIHDAARPFVSADTIARTVEAARQHGGAIAAVPVSDTLKRGTSEAGIAGTVDREGLWQAQTPQVFGFKSILAAHEAHAGEALTDDAAVAERAGMAVFLVSDDRDNFKITTAADLERARQVVAPVTKAGGPPVPDVMPGETRVGNGFDVHGFGPADGQGSVRLCGVDVPHDRPLAGHSDADVALHAVTDAILGAVAAGDIGAHFPPGDARWRGVASQHFVIHAKSLAAAEGFVVRHVDVTIICERPKVGPHRAAMQQALAAMLDLAPSRVSVKATTTEKLGFLGRGEGIAAMATATLVATADT